MQELSEKEQRPEQEEQHTNVPREATSSEVEESAGPTAPTTPSIAEQTDEEIQETPPKQLSVNQLSNLLV